MSERSNDYVECLNSTCGWEGQEFETVRLTHTT